MRNVERNPSRVRGDGTFFLFAPPPSSEWIAGDRRWARVDASIQWIARALSVFLVVVVALNILWDIGRISSAQVSIVSWTVPYSWLGFAILFSSSAGVALSTLLLRSREAVLAVAPMTGGLAIRQSLLWTRVIPWANVRWTNPTHLEWAELIGTGRIKITVEQSERIRRWFRPS